MMVPIGQQIDEYIVFEDSYPAGGVDRFYKIDNADYKAVKSAIRSKEVERPPEKRQKTRQNVEPCRTSKERFDSLKSLIYSNVEFVEYVE